MELWETQYNKRSSTPSCFGILSYNLTFEGSSDIYSGNVHKTRCFNLEKKFTKAFLISKGISCGRTIDPDLNSMAPSSAPRRNSKNIFRGHDVIRFFGFCTTNIAQNKTNRLQLLPWLEMEMQLQLHFEIIAICGV